MPGPFLNIFKGLGGGGGPPDLAEPGAGGLFAFLNGLIFLRPEPIFLKTWSGGGGAGGGLCAITELLI